MDDQTPNPTTRMDTPEPAGVDAPPPPPAAPPPPTAQTAPTGWAQQQRQGSRRDGGRWWSIIVGLVILAIGLWFFADRTLELDMPDIRWSQLWPVILIVIGVVVLVGAMRRDRR
jgi:uncharacterized integral membrane protein